MLVWLIKLSRITSVKCAKLQIFRSKIAHVLTIAIVLSITWAIIFSPIPLVVSVFIGSKLFVYWFHQQILPTAILGSVTIHGRTSFDWQEENYSIRGVNLLFAWWFIALKDNRGSGYLIWRDGCSNVDYRHLLVVLKNAHRSR